MTARRAAVWGLLVALAAGAVAVAAIVIPKWFIDQQPAASSPEPAAAPAARKIRARLFYVADDGQRLVATDGEVTYGEGAQEQARRLVEAQLLEAPKPLTSPVPAGTRLRALYVTASGHAFVDLSPEVRSGHPGGALSELLTVYAIVNVLTTNLPAITAVQILVDGREVDTLAGHVDLRRPLAARLPWLQELPPQPAPVTPPVE